MQIVIDIPEEEYNWIIKSDKTVFADVASKECMLHAIKNGTPLPKRHGALIDREELRNKYASWYNLAIDKSINAILTLELYQIEPIIPAVEGMRNDVTLSN